MVVELSECELLRIHPELPNHLQMGVRDMEAPSRLDPALDVLRELLLAHVRYLVFRAGFRFIM